MRDKLMINLTPKFQKELFSKLLKEYPFKKASKITSAPISTIYQYRNNKVNFIPVEIVKKTTKITNTSHKKLEENTIEIKRLSKIKKKYLDIGRDFRKESLKQYRRDIPKINKIIDSNYLYLEKWFFFYKKLIDFGVREFINIESKKNKLSLEYTCFSKGKKKRFRDILPRKIRIDETFLYFFGLWVGDKAGKGRMGVSNKTQEILEFTEHYLKSIYQNIEKYLYIGEKEIDPNIKVNRVFITKGKENGYSISVHSPNSILKRFFDYLEENLMEIIKTKREKSIFLSGLFDAEGNIFLEDKCFRWSCKTKTLLNKLIPLFKELKIFRRYDGANIVSYDKEFFSENILPYLKNKEKINKANLLIYKKGTLDQRFLNILNNIKLNPNISNGELAKVLKRAKVYAQTRFLEELGHIKTMNYPKSMIITSKGLNAVRAFQKEVSP